MSEISGLKKLSEENLTRQPEEVFDIICKLGEGSYGSVYKALHKESGQILAIKQVAVDTDLQEIIKEISFMQQCESSYIVKYYGSYFKNTDLWIVMEYCGVGSVSDIMRLRKKTLEEHHIAVILSDTLKGLEYLHAELRIHRDIKAANILLNLEGHAKLADLGIASQLSDRMSKTNTLTGTPFWMAPEVIQEVGYNCVADIWSLGITAIEMAEGKPPYAEIHPMRAIFMIPAKPPPSFRDPDRWSSEFIDFVDMSLVKNPEYRATASVLLAHPFILNAKSSAVLYQIIDDVVTIRETKPTSNILKKSSADVTIRNQNIREYLEKNTLDFGKDDIILPNLDVQSELGTMIVNSGVDSEAAKLEQKITFDLENIKLDDEKFQDFDLHDNATSLSAQLFENDLHVPFTIDLEYLKYLNYEQLQKKMSVLDSEMEKEINELVTRYHKKRQLVLDAIQTKRKRLQSF